MERAKKSGKEIENGRKKVSTWPEEMEESCRLFSSPSLPPFLSHIVLRISIDIITMHTLLPPLRQTASRCSRQHLSRMDQTAQRRRCPSWKSDLQLILVHLCILRNILFRRIRTHRPIDVCILCLYFVYVLLRRIVYTQTRFFD